MTVNRGKDFEECIRSASEALNDVSVIRLIDPQNGFAGVRNICDFIMYRYPYQMFIECKSVHGNTLPFTNITKNQWSGMLEQSKIDGCIAGVICWFVDHDKTVFIPIEHLEDLKNRGAKSVNVIGVDADTDIIEIHGKKKRVFFDYDMDRFFKTLSLQYRRDHEQYKHRYDN